ncbi:MAG: nitrous oxide reductase family maturation protein NosD [Dehalococcoidia bacterium]
MTRHFFAAALIAWLLFAAGPLSVGDAHATEGVISPRGHFATLDDALAVAADGETIDVYGGLHEGPIAITSSVTLRGHDWPVIDGAGTGSVVTISAPSVSMSGFVIRGSGIQLFAEDAAIQVNAPLAVIEGNRISDSLFGIYLRESHDSIVRNNKVVGKDLDPARRGDAIRLWSSHRVTVDGNSVRGARDLLLSYSNSVVLTGNTVTDGRYAFHFMYCDDALVAGNHLTKNSVGVFLMYSRRLHLRDNVIGENRGPSGYAIGLKDVDEAVIHRNLFADNRVGAYIDNSPSEIGSTVRFESNVFIFNDFGLRLMPSVRNNEYLGNSFIDNNEQVNISGGGALGANLWAVNGRGNYWSDYAGYDADGDGVGDIPYRSEKLFENLVSRNPELRILSYSPSSQAIDFAARVVPFTRPEPKLIDLAPLISPGALPGMRLQQDGSLAPVVFSSVGLLGIAVSLGLLARRLPGGRPRSLRSKAPRGADPLVHVAGLSKQFGANHALRDVSFQVRRGEGLALWGANGAGKTTAIRCLLGLIHFEGTVIIGGHDVRSEGRKARRLVGFVPQEMGFAADTPVEDTIRFFAGLRGSGHADADRLLQRMGLAVHRRKQVRQLSGGLRQRLAIAVSLLGDPPVLVMDEPTANLDAAGRQDVLRVLESLKRGGKTFILASHRPAEIGVLADRVVVLEAGRINDELTVEDFQERLTGASDMHLTLPPASVDQALSTLECAGYRARRNGNGVIVQIRQNAKAAPVTTLVAAGLKVIDFDVLGINEEAGDV